MRRARSTGEFRILAVLPDSDGQVQYRVRSETEGFDRRVAAGEIDTDLSTAPRTGPEKPAARGGSEPWFKPSSIKIGK
jgi:hypothetical protein